MGEARLISRMRSSLTLSYNFMSIKDLRPFSRGTTIDSRMTIRSSFYRPVTVAALAAIFALMSFASAPVANVSSSQSFALDGHAIKAAGITSWPVVVGDEITTSAAPAVMSFQDGSSVQLAPRSRVKISGTIESPKVVLTAGNLEYKLAPGSTLSLTKEDVNSPDPGSGTPAPTPPQATVNVQSNRGLWIEGLLFAMAGTALAVSVYDLVNLPAASSH